MFRRKFQRPCLRRAVDQRQRRTIPEQRRPAVDVVAWRGVVRGNGVSTIKAKTDVKNLGLLGQNIHLKRGVWRDVRDSGLIPRSFPPTIAGAERSDDAGPVGGCANDGDAEVEGIGRIRPHGDFHPIGLAVAVGVDGVGVGGIGFDFGFIVDAVPKMSMRFVKPNGTWNSSATSVSFVLEIRVKRKTSVSADMVITADRAVLSSNCLARGRPDRSASCIQWIQEGSENWKIAMSNVLAKRML